MPLTTTSPDLLATLTAEIVSAYVKKHVVRSAELTKVIGDVHAALATIGADKAPELPQIAAEKPKPPVSVRKSIQDDYLICLEDGKKFKTLKRHLMAHYQLTPEQYREKWNLPDDYPMVAPAYAARRKQLALDIGLGRKPGPRQSGSVPVEGEKTPSGRR